MNDEQKKLPKAVFQQTIGYLLTGFGLVVALAWNDAIQTLFKEVFGAQGSLIAKFAYAIIVTTIVTIITIRLSRWTGEEKK